MKETKRKVESGKPSNGSMLADRILGADPMLCAGLPTPHFSRPKVSLFAGYSRASIVLPLSISRLPHYPEGS